METWPGGAAAGVHAGALPASLLQLTSTAWRGSKPGGATYTILSKEDGPDDNDDEEGGLDDDDDEVDDREGRPFPPRP